MCEHNWEQIGKILMETRDITKYKCGSCGERTENTVLVFGPETRTELAEERGYHRDDYRDAEDEKAGF